MVDKEPGILLLAIQTESLVVCTLHIAVNTLLMFIPFPLVQWCLQPGISNPKLMSRCQCQGDFISYHTVLHEQLN